MAPKPPVPPNPPPPVKPPILFAAFPMLDPISQKTYFGTFDPTQGFNDTDDSSSHSFKVEEIAPGRTPTVSRVILSYTDLGQATISVILSGTNDNQKEVNQTKKVQIGTPDATGAIMTKFVDMSITAQNIQCTIFRAAGDGNVSIAKVTLCGTVERQQYA
jgi:hypothetical protein